MAEAGWSFFVTFADVQDTNVMGMKNRGFCFFLLLVGVATHANTLLVPNDYPRIQAAIDAANNGDTVLVSPGTYFENLDFKGKAITVASRVGPQSTIIDGDHAGAVIHFGNGEGTNSVLEGFTVQNGRSPWGSGVSLFVTSPTIISNIFQYNAAEVGYWGAAIGGWSSSPTIEKNVFRFNWGDNQYLTGVASFVNGSSPLIANNIFASNDCRAITLILPAETYPVIINNTIVGNRMGINANILGLGTFCNNAIFGNDFDVGASGEIIWKHNLVGGDYSGIPNQTGINGNISGNPLFVSAGNGDYRLTAGSPCIDAGLNGAPRLPALDFLGGLRIIAGISNHPAVVDIGAFEFNPNISLPSLPTVQCPATVTAECAQPVTVTALVGKTDGGGLTVMWKLNGITVQTNVVPAGNPPTSANVSLIAALPFGTNLVEATAVDDAGNTASGTTTVTVADTTAPVIVNASAFPNVLSRPRHKMVTVTVNATVQDDCRPANWQITSVQSNQPVSGRGNGRNALDWQILGDHTVALRAERSGNSERIYTIALQAQDAAGNFSISNTVTVTVP